jgi:hypothetical protein
VAISALEQVMELFSNVKEVSGRGDYIPIHIQSQSLANGNKGPQDLRDTTTNRRAVDMHNARATHLLGQRTKVFGEVRVKEFGVGFEGGAGQIYSVEHSSTPNNVTIPWMARFRFTKVGESYTAWRTDFNGKDEPN